MNSFTIHIKQPHGPVHHYHSRINFSSQYYPLFRRYFPLIILVSELIDDSKTIERANRRFQDQEKMLTFKKMKEFQVVIKKN